MYNDCDARCGVAWILCLKAVTYMVTVVFIEYDLGSSDGMHKEKLFFHEIRENLD
jgi:hypothetical protein